MNKQEWIKQVTAACQKAGTYQDYFDAVIETLADILAKRDEMAASGDGSTQVLRIISLYNRDALAYWRDLGLTPAGLKKLNENALKTEKKKGTALEEALARLGGGA